MNQIHRVYFIGIGGIGMSNLARYMAFIGKAVSGYDKTPSPITSALQTEGISVHFFIDVNRVLNENFDLNTTLIVYTPAVKQDENDELNYFLTHKYFVVKRAELLGIITRDTICLAIAGTHGKTTTSCLLGHILKAANVPATSFLGGISENYQTNLILGGNKYSVVEADEFDRSFLKLYPDYACITATDADHLDIYKDAADFESTFTEFAALVTKKIFVRNGLKINGLTFGIDDYSDYQAQNIKVDQGAFVFDIKTPVGNFNLIKLYLPGRHNVLNALAAIALASSIGVSLKNIAIAIESFKGVQRRFSYRIKTENLILIDDYAHHPTEINALYNAVRELYPTEKLLAIFQPHLYTRTRDFENGFVQSLAQFDQIALLPIYEAREHSIVGVNSAVLVQKIAEINKNITLIQPNDIFDIISKSANRVVLMIGAGDIGEMVTNVVKQINK